MRKHHLVKRDGLWRLYPSRKSAKLDISCLAVVSRFSIICYIARLRTRTLQTVRKESSHVPPEV